MQAGRPVQSVTLDYTSTSTLKRPALSSQTAECHLTTLLWQLAGSLRASYCLVYLCHSMYTFVSYDTDELGRHSNNKNRSTGRHSRISLCCCRAELPLVSCSRVASSRHARCYWLAAPVAWTVAGHVTGHVIRSADPSDLSGLKVEGIIRISYKSKVKLYMR